MSRELLERRQVWVYLVAITFGLALGGTAPGVAPWLERLLWPGLALLLYATFTQVRLNQLPAAFKDIRFITAALVGNFAVLPLVVWGVLLLVPDDSATRLGLVLVLLVPCSDWFITFAHQGGGDLRRAIAITPLLLVAQIALLPLYLWLFMGTEFMEVVSAGHMVSVFFVVIIVPLLLAYATERWASKVVGRTVLMDRLGWFPVPLLAVVLFLISASQVESVLDSLPELGRVLIACLAFLVGAVLCSLAVGKVAKLPTPQARTLLFSLSTRNSFVVLPFALALPAVWETAAIVIVFQSLIELFSMLALLWLVPRKLLR